ncbi:hypothetical protein ACVMIH_007181 [Bradyrhizobium sp. USDA 4503]
MCISVLGSLCMAAAALPVAMHLRFAVWEVWAFALLVGIGAHLLNMTLREHKAAEKE